MEGLFPSFNLRVDFFFLWSLLAVSKPAGRKPFSFSLKGKNRTVFLIPIKALGIYKFGDVVFAYETVRFSPVFCIPSQSLQAASKAVLSVGEGGP